MQTYIIHSINCTISSSNTPGIPKSPTISEFKGFIAIDKLNIPPTKLKKNKMTPPINPLINSLIIILMGTTKSIPII